MSEISEIFKFFIEGLCTSLLGISGIIGNVVSVAVLSSSELDMMPSFRHLLKMLAAFDATFLIFTLALFGISPWSTHYDQFIKPWLIPYFLPIIQVYSYLLFIDLGFLNKLAEDGAFGSYSEASGGRLASLAYTPNACKARPSSTE